MVKVNGQALVTSIGNWSRLRSIVQVEGSILSTDNTGSYTTVYHPFRQFAWLTEVGRDVHVGLDVGALSCIGNSLVGGFRGSVNAWRAFSGVGMVEILVNNPEEAALVREALDEETIASDGENGKRVVITIKR